MGDERGEESEQESIGERAKDEEEKHVTLALCEILALCEPKQQVGAEKEHCSHSHKQWYLRVHRIVLLD
jgi:hypothetical protein